MKRHALLATMILVVALISVMSAGCVNSSNPNPSPASPLIQNQSNVAGVTPAASSGIPTSINGHTYTYYHNLNDRSTCSLCHSNMQ